MNKVYIDVEFDEKEGKIYYFLESENDPQQELKATKKQIAIALGYDLTQKNKEWGFIETWDTFNGEHDQQEAFIPLCEWDVSIEQLNQFINLKTNQ